MSNIIKGYKITDRNGICRDQKYEVGQKYIFEGEIELCERGFHACQSPIDCMVYHDIRDARFFEVEASGEIIHDKDKFVCSELKLVKELELKEYLSLCVEYELSQCGEGVESCDFTRQASSGDFTHQASSGDWTCQASSGDWTRQASSGNDARQASSGDDTSQASSGNNTRQASSGYNAHQASSGYDTRQASSGDRTRQASSGNGTRQASSGYAASQASSGDFTHQASSGDRTRQASSGYDTRQASSGDFTRQASSGNGTRQASSGDRTRQASSGDWTCQASSGDCTRQASLGDNSSIISDGCASVVAGIGVKNKVKISDRESFFVLVDWRDGKPFRGVVKKAGQKCDGLTIKLDHWYWFEGGKLQEEKVD